MGPRVETTAERRRAVQVGLILLACAAGLAALWLAREIVLLAFLGVLIGVVFSFPVGWLSRFVPRGVAVLLVLLALVGAGAGLVALAAPTLEREFEQLDEAFRSDVALAFRESYAAKLKRRSCPLPI